MNTGLARHSDPSTSHRAAEAVSLELDDRHRKVFGYLYMWGPLTDDQLADTLVARQVYARHEQARRAIRTLRENYGLIVPFLNDDGTHAEAVNSSGRMARLWKACR